MREVGEKEFNDEKLTNKVYIHGIKLLTGSLWAMLIVYLVFTAGRG